MRTARLILGTVLAAAVLVLIGGLPARAADEVFDRTVPLAAGGSFSLQNVNGSVIGKRLGSRGCGSARS